MPKRYAEHVVKGTALIFVMTLTTNLISYLIRIFLARSLTPMEFGLVYAAIAFISLLNIFRNLGMGQTMQKKVPEFLVAKSYGKIKYAMKFSFTIQFVYAVSVLAVVLLFAQQIAATIFQTPAAVPLLVVLAVFGLFHAANAVIISTLQGLRRVKLYTTLEFLNFFLRFGLVAILIPLGTLALPVSQLASTIIFVAVGILVFTSNFPHLWRAKTTRVPKEILAFSVPVMVGLVASTAVENFSTVALSSLRSLTEVALYQVALPLANIMLILASSVTIILLPLVSELWAKHNKKTLRQMVGLLTKAMFALIVPLALIFITFPEIIINVLFGETYVAAAGALQLLTIAVIFQSFSLLFTSLLLGIDKPMTNTKIAFAIAGVNVVATLALIPMFGITGAALALITAHGVGMAALLQASHHHVRFHFQARNFIKILFGATLTAAIIYVIKTALVINLWVELIAALIAGFVFYAIFILTTRTITRSELALLFSTDLPIPKFIKTVALNLAE